MDEKQVQNHSPLGDILRTTIDKLHEMVDTSTIVGEPIHTPDGVTLIPVSKITFGIGGGGSDYDKAHGESGFGGGSGAGGKIEPVAFLVIQEGVTRVLPVAIPPANSLERLIDMLPDVINKVENYSRRKKETD